MTKTALVTTKGQVVIPSGIRRKYNIKKGTKLYIEEKDDEIILKPITPAYFDKLTGILPTKGKLIKALLKEKASEKERER